MKSASELNAKVTQLILEAERHDRDGAKLWLMVADAEQAITNSTDPEISDLERDIARDGAIRAAHRAKILAGKCEQ